MVMTQWYYTVSRCRSQVSIEGTRVSREQVYATCQVAQHHSEAQDPNHCQVVRTPILERRRSHRERCRLSYGSEYDVSST